MRTILGPGKSVGEIIHISIALGQKQSVLIKQVSSFQG